MTYLLYTIVILASTTLGAIAGLGGCIIIKPLLDLIGAHDATSIGIYSSVAVFTMCVVSLSKQIRGGFSFDRKVVLAISLGSLVGGLVGERIFGLATSSLDNNTVKAVQAGLLAITLALILVYTLRQEQMPSWHVSNSVAVFARVLPLARYRSSWALVADRSTWPV